MILHCFWKWSVTVKVVKVFSQCHYYFSLIGKRHGFSSEQNCFSFSICPKSNILLKQFVSATPLKLWNRILWNFFVMKDIYCVDVHVCRTFWLNFFLGIMPLYNLEACPIFKINYWNRLSVQLFWACTTEFHVTLYLKWTYCVHVNIHKKFLIFYWENIDLNGQKYIILCTWICLDFILDSECPNVTQMQ